MVTPPRTGFRSTLKRFILSRMDFRNKKAKAKQTIALTALSFGLALTALGVTTAIHSPVTKASDHDDGDIDVRSRALSLTDLYVFREQDQNPSASQDDLVFVMNTNPRSLARVQYYFSNQAQYNIKISRVTNKDAVPTAIPDLTLQFTFSNPGAQQRQKATLKVLDRNGRTTTVANTTTNRPILTTPMWSSSTPTINSVRVGGSNLSIFAGLREDPFYFDVEQFFRVRAGLLGYGPAVGFRSPQTAQDFTVGYNVNSIVVRVPRKLLQGSTKATTFDAWLSINIPDPRTGQFTQTEQLARPGINELLVIKQANYALYNRIEPTRAKPPASLAGDVVKTLSSLGNNSARVNALLGAFLPDVMRIDTTAPSGYGNALNSKGAPIRGRLLKDDVIDISLSVLTNGAVTTDNVSYEGVAGNPGQGHHPLVSSFPYLALPN